MAQLRDRGCADKYRGAVSRCISSRWGSASRPAIRWRSRRRPHEKCAAERLAGGATTVPPPHPGQRNSSPSTAPRAHRRIHASPLCRRSVRGGSDADREASIAAGVRDLRIGFVKASLQGAGRAATSFGRIALHVLAVVVLYLALCTVLRLGLQVDPAWGTVGFAVWLGLIAAWVRWTRRRGRRERGSPPSASRPGPRRRSRP